MKEVHLLLLGAITPLLFGALPSVVHGQQHTSPQESHVTLSLNEFQELFSSARLQEAERRLLDQRKKLTKEHERKLQEFEDWKRALQKQAQQERSHVFPENYQVLHHTAAGIFDPSLPESGVEGDVASFDLHLVLRLVDSKWTVIPLANTTSMVASDWSVSWKDDSTNEDFAVVDPITSSDTMLLLRDEQQVLATNRSGVFSVTFKAHTRVGKTRNLNTLSLSSLLYPLSSFTLRIANDEDESNVGDFAVQPASALLQVETTANFTDVKATLPLTADGIQVKWLDIAMEDKVDVRSTDSTKTTKASREPEPQAPPQVTATHEVLHTVGEGIIKSFHILEFAATSEMSSLNYVEFAVHCGEHVRITSVMGHALQSWSTQQTEDASSKLVRATFKSSSLESTVTLHVHTEMDTADITEVVELPRIECKNVLRQVGHVAVIKDAQVEVHKNVTRGVSRCEPSDISSQLRSNIDRPIILSYKYLNPDNSILVSVKEHVAMETLEAAVDRIHYKAIVTDTHTVHNVILILQSTKLQYLKLLGMPLTASMFTVAVNSVPTKPVEGDPDDGGGSILIPLLVGLDTEVANEGGSMQTSVELNYISSHDSLGHNGTLHLAPPQLELPISVMTVHLRLPKAYEYEFTGDFGSKPKKQMEFPVPSTFSYTTGKRVVEKDYKFSVVDDFWPEDVEEGKIGAVKIVTPNIGTSYHFQRLLVVDTETSLDVKYSERVIPKKRSWLQNFLGL